MKIYHVYVEDCANYTILANSEQEALKFVYNEGYEPDEHYITCSEDWKKLDLIIADCTKRSVIAIHSDIF